MKVTIEYDGKTNVYEDVQMFAGAVVMIEKTAALSIMDPEIEKSLKAIVCHASAAHGMRLLLAENSYVLAEGAARAMFEATGEELFPEVETGEES